MFAIYNSNTPTLKSCRMLQVAGLLQSRGAKRACGDAILGARWTAVRAGAGALEQRVLQAHVVVAHAQARAEVQRHQQLPEQVPRLALAEPLPVRAAKSSVNAYR